MKQSRRPWTKDQDNAVRNLVKQIGLRNWPLISNLMKQRFNIQGRSGKQCRQRWHNQLNPEVNKMPWTDQEQKLLFQAHKSYRNRWIDISKLFEGRTDNSIKNHFYSTIRRSLRRICKLLGNKNSTSQLRNIKPSTLSKIFQYSQLTEDQVTKENSHIVQQSKIITQQLLNFARSKPSKALQIMDEAKLKNLQFLIHKLNQFSQNNSYEKKQKPRNQSFQTVNIKKSQVIIIKSQKKFNQVVHNDQNIKIQVLNKKIIQNQEKQYIYDWEQFEQKCHHLKSLLLHQMNEQNVLQDSINQECSLQIENSKNSDLVSLQEQLIQKRNEFETPRNFKNYSFLPYKSNNKTDLMKYDFQTTIDKLKSDSVQSPIL